MKAAHNQSPGQRQALLAEFNNHPQTVALQAALVAHAAATGLQFNEAGMSEMNAFAAAWKAEHGALPESGIAIG